MLTIYRRHLKTCEHRSEGRSYRRCKCPIWVDGLLGTEDIRESLKTRDWEKASKQVRGWEARGSKEEEKKADLTTIVKAWEQFQVDAQSRGLRTTTIYKYVLLERQLASFATNEGLTVLKQLDLDTLSRFRSTWKDGPIAAGKKLERLRAFFSFCRDRNWIDDNPARKLKSPKFKQRPTMPFSHDEMMRINAAATRRVDMAPSDHRNKARLLRALVLLLRYTGLRISDAVGCSTDRLRDGKIWLYTQKTGQHVYCPLPAFVTKELEAVPRVSDHYWFFTGNGTVETARKKWSESLAALFHDANVKNGHAHRFRDTFAVELLLDGTPIENVQAFLGHASVRVTERHYAPWVRARQERAEADVKRSWDRDPLVLMETKGTPEVHGQPN
jgi:integrase/recombinase XerD